VLGDSMNQREHSNHLQGTAEGIERELGDARPFNLFEGVEEEWEQQPVPDGPMTVGIDGGYVRAARKQGWFEVIAVNFPKSLESARVCKFLPEFSRDG
jgi:hypothetical protein